MRKTLVIAFALALAMAASVSAQGARFNSPTSFPWWNNPVANGLNLSDTQTKQINATVSEYRGRLTDLYAAVNKAENDLEEVFKQDPIDGRKGEQAVDQLANARGDLTRTLSQMSLKLRMVLTAEQWQDLQNQNQRGRGPARPGAHRRGPAPASKNGPAPGPPPAGGSQKFNPSAAIAK